ncbi:hypothetical protein EYF80_058443 [Liparis tanakae]|uniref:Uncharacterized protein n=1 Tax=Liparis tanakae TaxID=230148 RepID=A0A4Z2ER53_9TELE|nr:hypothetical protein EYF80_058443 [Liparis tanakae]
MTPPPFEVAHDHQPNVLLFLVPCKATSSSANKQNAIWRQLAERPLCSLRMLHHVQPLRLKDSVSAAPREHLDLGLGLVLGLVLVLVLALGLVLVLVLALVLVLVPVLVGCRRLR